MGRSDGHSTPAPPETLQRGPSRQPFLGGLPTGWRPRVRPLLAFALGVVIGGVIGGGALFWWSERPSPTSPVERPDRRALLDEHDVELVLFRSSSPRSSGPGSAPAPLRIDGGVLLSGAVTSTVSKIESSDGSVEIRTVALPVTVSPTARFQAVTLEVFVEDCRTATRWRPADRPFLITWRDEYGKRHLDRAGDFDKSLSVSLVRFVADACRSR